jgi:hypothetical protein
LSNGRALFTPETQHENGRRRVVQVLRCGDCPAVKVFNVNTATRGGMSDETILRKAALLGWESARKGRELLCPDCARGSKRLAMVHKLAVAPDEVREIMSEHAGRPVADDELRRAADVLRVEAVLDDGSPSLQFLERTIVDSGAGAIYDKAKWPRKEPPPMNAHAAPAPIGPRQPAREDKRRILERLSDVYTNEEVGYSKDWTDDKLAASLSVPVAWVRDLRVEFHGENAGNEATEGAAKARVKVMNELRTDIHRIETKLTAELSRFESDLAGCRARLAKLEAEA